MRVYDRFGYPHEVPDYQPIGRGHPFERAQLVYDGFGDPVGFAFLAPFLPLIAKAAGALLPTVTSLLTSSPRAAAAPPPSPSPQPAPPPQAMRPSGPLPSAAAPSPQIVVIREPAPAIPPPMPPPGQIVSTTILRPRRLRRRRVPVRLRVARATDQMSVPSPSAVRMPPTSTTAEPLPAEPASSPTETSSAMSGWYPVHFGSYL
jgi:hypothetical protein